MNTINDGGPAFPGVAGMEGYGNSTRATDPNGETAWTVHNQGMSFRDWLAGMALQGQLAAERHGFDFGGRWDQLADQSFKIADAMLAARERKTEP